MRDAIANARRAAEFIAKRQSAEASGPVTLVEVANHCGLSPWHLQRQFKRVMGVSPRQYDDALRLSRLKQGLRRGNGVADATFAAGFGSSSRVYERAGQALGMTPASYAKGGAGAEIAYAIVASPLGKLLVAATKKGLCRVAFGERDQALQEALAGEFPRAASLKRDEAALKSHIQELLRRIGGKEPARHLPVDIRVTAFQQQVFEALRRIPKGKTGTYGSLAAALGKPGAGQAVGQALSANPVAIAIPCHRILRNDGAIGGYAWGAERKQALIAAEQRGASGKVKARKSITG
jgi:AraC family transcriptional regulator, regulatory protein of adaptative response / methylated-DNA-[protein]-cysteine methyltransferase